MTSLLKADRVSMLGLRKHVGAAKAVDEAVPAPNEAEETTERLQHALADALGREDNLRRHADDREREAFEKGRAEGELQALECFEKDWTAQQEAFRLALLGCVDRINEEFVRLEQFALDLAETALARLIGDTSWRRDLLLETLSHHTRALAADAIVVIHVSPDDLPEGSDALSSLPAHIASRVRVQPDLTTGQCRVELRAGTLDVGLDLQAARLAAAFERLRQT